MKKRIAIWTFGGVGTGHFSQGMPVMEQLINGLSRNFQISVYSLSPPNQGYSNSNFVVRSPSKPIYPIFGWLSLVRLFLSDHSRNKYHLVMAFWGWPAGCIVTVLGKLLSLPSAVYLLGGDAAGVPAINYGILHRPLLRNIAKWTYLNTNLLLAISQYQKDQLAAYGIRRSLAVIPWGVNTDRYQFKERSTGDVVRFIHVGHLSPVKDQTTLIKAFAIINRKQLSHLTIFGYDTLNGRMQNLCSDLGIAGHVSFRDVVPHHEMPGHYQSADVMLHTSLSEGQSMALTEAAASGVLMAGTRVGLLYDLQECCGITVDHGNYEELATKVLEILQNRPAWEKSIRNARAWSENHSFAWTIKELTAQLSMKMKTASQ